MSDGKQQDTSKLSSRSHKTTLKIGAVNIFNILFVTTLNTAA